MPTGLDGVYLFYRDLIFFEVNSLEEITFD